MSNNKEMQDDEIMALKSIFGEYFHSFNSDEFESGTNEKFAKGGELRIHVELPSPFSVSFYSNSERNVEEMNVEYLPPLCLYFTFPENYPSSFPPTYTLSCKWISRYQLSLLCSKLDTLWDGNENQEIVFLWAQFLKEETLSHLGMKNGLKLKNIILKRLKSDGGPRESCAQERDRSYSESCSGIDKNPSVNDGFTSSLHLDPRAIQDVASTSCLVRLLKEYDEEMRQKAFDSKQFSCKVCFCDKSGCHCIKFWPCHHVYCKLCMKSYFEVQINEGNFKFLKCPEEKCESEANPKQVEKLVSSELYNKWESMLLNFTLSSLGDIQVCPRQHCQYPVTIEENQGHCPSCGFVFCGLCRYGWHGLEKCKFKSGEVKQVLETYLNGTEEQKAQLENKFGQKYLSVMLQEFLSSNYMDENAKSCPRCRSNIEKVDGCNKMSCKQCRVNFCWLCEKQLDCMNPYNHYNNPASNCFNMLFAGVIDDDEFEVIDHSSDEEW